MSIAQNKKAFHDYFVEQKFETGIVLEGWEVKAIRAGPVQLKESYVIVRDGEIFLIGCHISPLLSASTHFQPDPVRTRKLLLHTEEINRLIGSVERAGYTLLPFGQHVEDAPGAGAVSFIGNVIWFIVAGLWLAIGHLVTGIALMITIIGIPLALANFKMIPISMAPLGKQVVRLNDPYALQTVS